MEILIAFDTVDWGTGRTSGQ